MMIIAKIKLSNYIMMKFGDILAILIPCLIALLFIGCIVYFARRFFRSKIKRGQKSVFVQVLSNELKGGPVELIGERGRVASGNTYGRVAFHRIAFWSEAEKKEYVFTVDENNEAVKNIRPGMEGTLTFSKDVFVSFQSGKE